MICNLIPISPYGFLCSFPPHENLHMVLSLQLSSSEAFSGFSLGRPTYWVVIASGVLIPLLHALVLSLTQLLFCPNFFRKRCPKTSNLMHSKTSANAAALKLTPAELHQLRIVVPPEHLDDNYTDKSSPRIKLPSTSYRSRTSRIPSRLWDPNSSSNIY